MHSIDSVVHACISLLQLHGYQMPSSAGSSSSNHNIQSGLGSAASSAAQQCSAGGSSCGGCARVAVVAHSYGTFVACRLMQLYEPALHSLALLDPVCCGMFMPHVSRLSLQARRACYTAARMRVWSHFDGLRLLSQGLVRMRAAAAQLSLPRHQRLEQLARGRQGLAPGPAGQVRRPAAPAFGVAVPSELHSPASCHRLLPLAPRASCRFTRLAIMQGPQLRRRLLPRLLLDRRQHVARPGAPAHPYASGAARPGRADALRRGAAQPGGCAAPAGTGAGAARR
jgi:hypothetical protein